MWMNDLSFILVLIFLFLFITLLLFVQNLPQDKDRSITPAKSVDRIQERSKIEITALRNRGGPIELLINGKAVEIANLNRELQSAGVKAGDTVLIILQGDKELEKLAFSLARLKLKPVLAIGGR
ncbi:hypothetical protein DRN32_03080 [Thermococci archaeon]|nr:MAG: hypothetical protein DRN32_03080 [Thermococci archaeon]